MNECETESDSSPNTTKHSGTNLYCDRPDYNPKDFLIGEGTTIKIQPMPGPSEWQCYLSGKPGDMWCTVYRPNKGQEPNWFHRKMQELAFGIKWRKTK